nr:hypothetical protein [Clostridia bacterium]
MEEIYNQLLNELIKQSEEKSFDGRGSCKKCFYFEGYALINGVIPQIEMVKKIKDKLSEVGVNVSKILAYNNSYFLEEKARGTHLYEMYGNEKLNNLINIIQANSLANENQEFYNKFIDDWGKIRESGLEIDPSKPTNFFYEKGRGINFIDLDIADRTVPESFEQMCLRSASILLTGSYDLSTKKFDEEQLEEIRSQILTKLVRALETKEVKHGETRAIISKGFPNIDISGSDRASGITSDSPVQSIDVTGEVMEDIQSDSLGEIDIESLKKLISQGRVGLSEIKEVIKDIKNDIEVKGKNDDMSRDDEWL